MKTETGKCENIVTETRSSIFASKGLIRGCKENGKLVKLNRNQHDKRPLNKAKVEKYGTNCTKQKQRNVKMLSQGTKSF